ncbi:Nitrogen permease regulator-like 2, partial [Halocaridina rubra]
MGEECGKEGPILSIFLAEFHNTAGPKIVYQYPEKSVSKDIFDAVSVYIIPKPQIQKRIITVNVLGHKITGYPNEINNPKYVRNALIFNLCFVCDSKSRTVQYEPAVKKLSEYLENLELENGFLSNEDSKAQMPNILKHILTDLNTTGKCTITINIGDKAHSFEHTDRKLADKVDRRPSLLCERRAPIDAKNSQDLPERRLSMVCDQRQLELSYRGWRKASDVESKPVRKPLDLAAREAYTTCVLHLK